MSQGGQGVETPEQDDMNRAATPNNDEEPVKSSAVVARESGDYPESPSHEELPSHEPVVEDAKDNRQVYAPERSVQRGPSTARPQSSIRRSLSRRFRGNYDPLAEINYEAESSNSAFKMPIPGDADPVAILIARFTAWRHVLKDLITYFRSAAQVEENKSKDLAKLANCFSVPFRDSDQFLKSGGIQDVGYALKEHRRTQSMVAADGARTITIAVVSRLEQQRSVLGSKLREIKHIAGDFRNNIVREVHQTKRCVDQLTEALLAAETANDASAPKDDPYTVRLNVDRQIRLQTREENYLHQAHLNLQASGRALEANVISEIEEALSEYRRVLAAEAQSVLLLADKLETSMFGISDSQEWNALINRDPNFVDPTQQMRTFDEIQYPGKNAPAAQEIRSGPLERKTKYLRSYTTAWYVLTGSLFLHEYKTADRAHEINPVMSLYLPECKLGDHSEESSSSHKFVLKGKQAGQFHRGHSWIFRAESHHAMMEWYTDIQNLCALGRASPTERDSFIVSHRRSNSNNSQDESIGLEHEEADDVPYSAQHSTANLEKEPDTPVRPEGGIFASNSAADETQHEAANATANATANAGGQSSEASDSYYEKQPDAVENTSEGYIGYEKEREYQYQEATASNDTLGRGAVEKHQSHDVLPVEMQPQRDQNRSMEYSNLPTDSYGTNEGAGYGALGGVNSGGVDKENARATLEGPFYILSSENGPRSESSTPSLGVKTIDLPIASQFAKRSLENENKASNDSPPRASSNVKESSTENAADEKLPGSYPEAQRL